MKTIILRFFASLTNAEDSNKKYKITYKILFALALISACYFAGRILGEMVSGAN